MFLHVVLIELASPDVAFLRNVEKLADRIATSSKDILDFRFVVNHANRSEGYNYAFFGRFIDEAAHERYQTMPEHEALKAYLAPRIKKLVVLDTHLA